MILCDLNGNVVFDVDGRGNVHYSGTFMSSARARTAAGTMVTAFSPKATLATLEDTGSGRLVGGLATISLEPTFAAAIDPRAGYRAFLTPHGDTRGLFVAMKTANGFIVRESQGGRTTTDFDYRILATALGQAGQRMSVAPDVAPRGTLPQLPRMTLPPAPVVPAQP